MTQDVFNPPTIRADDLVSSHVVDDFLHVRIAIGLLYPGCGKQFGPHATRDDGVQIRLRCDHCHRDALVCAVAEGGDE
jgi:hypothetical protein